MNPLTFSTAALADRARHGDASAFDELAAYYRPRLAAFFRRQGVASEAEDLTQETLQKAYASITSVNPPSIGGWLYRIAANLTIDRARAANSRVKPLSLDAAPDPDGEDGAIEVPDLRHEPAGTVEAAELRARVGEAIAELSEPHRRLIVLRDLQGLDYAAIAEITGLPVGTVKSRLFHARADLARRLRPYMSGVK
jgi:RNA polymerase sigma-70 factor (ECF subfamily)